MVGSHKPNTTDTALRSTTRNALAELIISFAAEGETNPKRLKELALAALPRTLGTP